MFKKKNSFGMIAVTLAVLASGCSSVLSTSVRPAGKAPQIIQDPADPSQRIWNDISLFGSVPPELQQTGDELCRSMNPAFKAYGYHPFAKGFDGISIKGGGYLCLTD